jgi:hypothetical protein
MVSCSADFLPWRLSWYVPTKCWFIYRLHGTISQKMAIFILLLWELQILQCVWVVFMAFTCCSWWESDLIGLKLKFCLTANPLFCIWKLSISARLAIRGDKYSTCQWIANVILIWSKMVDQSMQRSHDLFLSSCWVTFNCCNMLIHVFSGFLYCSTTDTNLIFFLIAT